MRPVPSVISFLLGFFFDGQFFVSEGLQFRRINIILQNMTGYFACKKINQGISWGWRQQINGKIMHAVEAGVMH